MPKPKKTPEKLDASKVPPGEHRVLLRTVVNDWNHQMRDKLNTAAIKQMANKLRGDGGGTLPIPPIQIIRVKGIPYLADGWHRFTAHAQVGLDAIDAIVTDGTMADLGRTAIQANLAHGVRYKGAEKRKIFKQFIKRKLHYVDGQPMSARALATELGNTTSHVTLLKWMKEDFPHEYQNYAKDPQEVEQDNSDPLVNTGKPHARVAQQNLENAREQLSKIDPNDRDSLQNLWESARILAADIAAYSSSPLGDEFDQPDVVQIEPAKARGRKRKRDAF